MARFIYRMQSILDVKQKLEDQAKIDFSMAKLKLDREQEKLDVLYGRQRAYLLEAQKLRENTLDFLKLKENQEAQKLIEQFIKNQNIEVQKAEKALEKERIKLLEYQTDRKMHEKLREKAFDEFMQEENRKESKEVDERTSYTYGRKAVLDN